MKPTAGWYPVGLEEGKEGGHCVVWQDLSAADFTAPFFEDAVLRARWDRSELRRTALDEMSGLSLGPGILPTAFILHASRSGSTLLSQMFSCLDGGLSISEPPVLDQIFRLRQNDEDKVALFRQVIRALGQRRSTDDRLLMIKHDSWHLPWLPLIQRAFPAVPCFFLYRDPVEILWSHHRQRGSQMVPELLDPALFEIEPDSLDAADLDGYAARVLESFFSRALPWVRLGKLVPFEYHRLIEKVPHEIFDRLGLELSMHEKERLQARCRYHSKRGRDLFLADSECAIPPGILARFQSLVAPQLALLYENLKAAESVQSG